MTTRWIAIEPSNRGGPGRTRSGSFVTVRKDGSVLFTPDAYELIGRARRVKPYLDRKNQRIKLEVIKNGGFAISGGINEQARFVMRSAVKKYDWLPGTYTLNKIDDDLIAKKQEKVGDGKRP